MAKSTKNTTTSEAISENYHTDEPVVGLTVPVSLRTFALAALAHTALDDTSPVALELQFLQRQLQAISKLGIPWNQALNEYLCQPAPVDQPLIGLAKALSLSTLELLTVAIAAAVETELMVGRAIAYLQAPVGGSRPTLGLLTTALACMLSEEEMPINVLATGGAIRSGLLKLLNEGAPLPEQGVSLPGHLGFALAGHDSSYPGTILGLGNTPAVPLPESFQAEAHRHATGLQAEAHRTLIIRTGSVPEGKSVALAIAEAMDRRPLFIETETITGLGPWILLRHLVPVFCLELAPGERKTLPTIPSYSGPVLVLCGPDGSVETVGGIALSWLIPVPKRPERQALWEQALGDCQLATDLARYHRHRSGRIAHLGHLAIHYSQLQGRNKPTTADVIAVARSGEGVGLDALAQLLPESIEDDALVIGSHLRAELDILLLRCRSRDGLVEGLGVAATTRYFPGVKALLVGPSGTGKTLAAGWLATQLGMPFYRVDLASVTSKYIGETEKNLAQLLSRAEQSEVVLLFDEADSLFGKRTDVQQANDRFANAQTNYLLQRIESFDGIALLTSNSRNRFDPAFTRRLDMVIEFPMPLPGERRLLWRSHLGEHHELSTQDLNLLSAKADLCGGHIRNVVLTAAVLAYVETRKIKYADIVQGLEVEYRKLGRQLPGMLKRSSF